jgi:hypothetical protein
MQAYNYRIKFILFSLLISCGIFSSCNQTDIAMSDPVPDCFDGLLNQGEIETDCGGPCPPCASKLEANVNGMNWVSAGSVTTQINGSAILISAGNANSSLSLIHNGPFQAGTYTLSSALYNTVSPYVNYTTNTGTITFTQWDGQNKMIFGTFSFKAFEVSGGTDSVVVNQGKFIFVPY